MMPHIQPPPDTSSLPFVGTCATKAKLRHFAACIPWTDDTLLMKGSKAHERADRNADCFRGHPNAQPVAWLKMAVESAWAQTMTDLEVIRSFGRSRDGAQSSETAPTSRLEEICASAEIPRPSLRSCRTSCGQSMQAAGLFQSEMRAVPPSSCILLIEWAKSCKPPAPQGGRARVLR